MYNIKPNVMKIDLTDQEIDDFINQCTTIGNWGISCKTLEQFEVVEEFFEKFNKKCYGTDNVKLVYNIGITTGVLLYKKHRLKKLAKILHK